MIDKFDRKINYARISLTSLCNLKCSYCAPYNSEKKNISLNFYKTLIDALDELKIKKIRFTGGEPLLNANIIKLVEYANNKENIKDIAITTNGILFDKYLDVLVKKGLNKINFSLDTISREIYTKLTGEDKFNIVIKNIEKAKKYGIEVKINAVLLKGITDKAIKDFLKFGYEHDIQIRFIELMPIGDNIEYYKKNYLSSEEVIKKLNCTLSEKNKIDEVATYYTYENKYDFGVISPISNHFCNSCNRIRITSKGKLRLCLHSDEELDLLKFKEDKQKMYEYLKEQIYYKPEKHFINEEKFTKSSMVQIGG